MKRSEKFRQANREAIATVVAAIAVIIFWCLAGFGLADSDITILHTPLWVWGGCVGTWIFAIIVTVILSEKVFVNFDLDEKEGQHHE
ncbi:YhdT family protein [Phascolarctobacterium sp.]|uniref:YhdT family protein n=1 Tax=Phascolarctobacterium sp. TaxID=2049039 RepID=UPI0038666E69